MTGTIVLPTAGPLTASAFSTDINVALAALSNMFQSGTAPTTGSTGLASLAGIWWHDTTNKIIKVRNQADSAWISVVTLDETNNLAGAKVLFAATARLLGRSTAGAGAAEEISLGAGLTMTGGVLSSTAGITSIASGSLSGTSQVFTSIPATYSYLVLQFTGLSFTGAATPLVRVSTDNGSSYDSTAGNYFGHAMSTGGVANTAQASLIESAGGSGSTTYTATMTIRGSQGGPYPTWDAILNDGATRRRIAGAYLSTSAINALQISGGTFDAGTYALFGVG